MKIVLKIIGWVLAGALSIIVLVLLIFGCVILFEKYRISEFEKKTKIGLCNENGGMATSEIKLYSDSTYWSYTGVMMSDINNWGRYKISEDTLFFYQEYNIDDFPCPYYLIDTINHNLKSVDCEEMTFYLNHK